MKLHPDYRLLELATDVAAMRRRFESLLASKLNVDATLNDFCVPRVLPRASGEVLIQYRFGLSIPQRGPTGQWIVYGEHYPFGLEIPQSPAMDEAGTCWFDELRLRVWLFPTDPQLPELPMLFNPELFESTYNEKLENVGIQCNAASLSTQLLSYRLGRRCIVRMKWESAPQRDSPASGREIIIKMSRPRQALALWTKLRQLECDGFNAGSHDQIVLPKHLFLHRSTGAIFQRSETGESLHSLIGHSLFPEGCAAAARALRKLHHTHLSGLITYTTDDELDHLAWLSSVTVAAFPSLRARVEAVMRDLVRTRPTKAPALVTVHRDFYDKQVLFDGRRTVLLDYDTLAAGDPALDYGNFVGHLQWRTHQSPEHAGALRLGWESFTQTFGHTDSGFETRSKWWTAAALLRLACLYSWRPRWQHLAPSLLRSRGLRHRARVGL